MNKILVIGDVIVDKYRYGKALGLSAETPTIVAEYTKTEVTLGGAALVARHLDYLGASVKLISIGDYLDYMSLDDGISHIEVPVDGWKTPCKERMFVGGYKLFQFDHLNHGVHHAQSQLDLMDKFDRHVKNCEVVVVADNRHGVIDEVMAGYIVRTCNELNKIVVIDSQVSQSESNHHWYFGADLFFVNERELNSIVPDDFLDDKIDQAKILLEGGIILKRGPLGTTTLLDNACIYTPARTVDAVDTCGAGDALMAAFVRFFRGDNWHEALAEANEYAAETCTYYGTKLPDEVNVIL